MPNSLIGFSRLIWFFEISIPSIDITSLISFEDTEPYSAPVSEADLIKINDLPSILVFTLSASFLFSKFLASKIDFFSLKKLIFSFVALKAFLSGSKKFLAYPDLTSTISPI